MKRFIKSQLPAFVVMGFTPKSNHISGLIERSFDLTTSKDYVRLFRTYTGVDNIFGKTHNVCGREHAEYQLESMKEKYPDGNWQIYDINDKSLPVTLDLKSWEMLNHKIAKTFDIRNVRFEYK